MKDGLLGREYADGEVICREGELGDRMYVIQAGRAAVWRRENDTDIKIAELQTGSIFGEMSIFERKPRSATVSAHGRARVLTLDKRAFLRGVHEDPSLAYRVLQEMSQRIRGLDEELAHLKRSSAAAAPPADRPRWLLVVSRGHLDARDDLLRRFSRETGVELLPDRRVGERRQLLEPHRPERRQMDRRRPPQSWTLHLAPR